MVHIYYDSSNTDYEAQAYGEIHRGTLDYLRQFDDRMGSILNEAGRAMFQATESIYRRVNDSVINRLARGVSRQEKNVWREDLITPLTNIGALQHAGLAMQRWLMANPVVRERFLAQQCDGYSGSYVNVCGKDIGEAHYDYRRAMSGVVVMKPDNQWQATTFFDKLRGDDRELYLDEQSDIQISWRFQVATMVPGADDSSSKYNAKL